MEGRVRLNSCIFHPFLSSVSVMRSAGGQVDPQFYCLHYPPGPKCAAFRVGRGAGEGGGGVVVVVVVEIIQTRTNCASCAGGVEH